MTQTRIKYLKKMRRNKLLVRSLQIAVILLFFATWELVAYLKLIDPFIISSPSRIVKIIISLAKKNNLFPHIFATLYETVLGFLISTVLGTLIAVILWWSPIVKEVAEPYLITLNALPKVALGPLIIIWVGAGKAATISPEINLIGKTVDEAVPDLEKYLDDAYLSHLEQVRIVHGRGTGALRNAVHQLLKRTKYIKEYHLGAYGEGDSGVTIAVFR